MTVGIRKNLKASIPFYPSVSRIRDVLDKWSREFWSQALGSKHQILLVGVIPSGQEF